MRYELINTPEPNLYREYFSYSEVPKIDFSGEVVPLTPPKEFWITDTTFRDGQQARPPYSVEQIVHIFQLLSKIGGTRGLIRQSEFFLYSDTDRKAVEKCQELGLKFPEITSWIRAVPKDFELVKKMGLKETGILTSCSDYHIFLKLKKTRRQALDSYKEVVGAALENGIIPRCHLEDATRADFYGFVIPMINEVMQMCEGTNIKPKFRLCDTMGFALPYPNTVLPRSVPAIFDAINKNTSLTSEQLEWHGHNDFHKGLTNAVMAWLHGCAAINGTFLGFGERTGNTPIEGLVFEWMGLTGIHDGITPSAITELAEYFEKELDHNIPMNTPFVGSDFNCTRAGIHADGLSKSEEIYNIFDTGKWLNRPCKVGITNTSGLAGIAYWIHTNFEGTAQTIRKDNPALIAIKEWIDAQYATGRTTSIGDIEMLEQIKKHLPDLIK